MSAEALNKIIEEVNALTSQERRELINRLTHDEQPDLSGSALSSLRTHEEAITADGATLREWLNAARTMRAQLPLSSDSVEILRELREVRCRK